MVQIQNYILALKLTSLELIELYSKLLELYSIIFMLESLISLITLFIKRAAMIVPNLVFSSAFYDKYVEVRRVLG